jgi:hypothetical protein
MFAKLTRLAKNYLFGHPDFVSIAGFALFAISSWSVKDDRKHTPA